MSDELREQISKELDDTLNEQAAADSKERLIRTEHDAAVAVVSKLSGRAHRLRMALYAIDDSKGSYGDANSDNHKRLRELQSGATS